ncbi:MAG: hypothetical protein ACYDAQ_20055 [Mycobacteriales bacterium]
MADVTATARVSRGERTRARLLDSARVAFRDVGWSQARVEDVCRVIAGLVEVREQSVALSWSGFGLDVGDRLIDGLTDLWAHAVYRAAAIHG